MESVTGKVDTNNDTDGLLGQSVLRSLSPFLHTLNKGTAMPFMTGRIPDKDHVEIRLPNTFREQTQFKGFDMPILPEFFPSERWGAVWAAGCQVSTPAAERYWRKVTDSMSRSDRDTL